MLTSARRTFRILLTASLAVVFAVFSIANRQWVTIQIPPYSVDLPLFMLVLACFALGALFAGLMLSLKMAKTKHQLRSERKNSLALANELSGLKSERKTTLPVSRSA